jgi:hypothetical protein
MNDYTYYLIGAAFALAGLIYVAYEFYLVMMV